MVPVLLAALLMSWTPPTIECGGAPLTDLAGYIARWRHIQVDATMTCIDGSGFEVPCYTAGPGWDEQVWVDKQVTQQLTTLPSEPPAVNEIYVYEVEAFDDNGNGSRDCLAPGC